MSETATSAPSGSVTPAVEGWFTTGPEPALIGTRCQSCGTISFPRETTFCRNPTCAGEEFEATSSCPAAARSGPTPTRSTSRRRRTSRPPTPTCRSRWPRSSCPRASSCSARSPTATASTTCRSGSEVELVVEPLYTDESGERTIWRWKPVGRRAGRGGGASEHSDVAVLGVGMHPWGKWGRTFVEYGVHAARAALADAGVAWKDVDLVVGGETVRNGYGGYVAGATFAQALGWNGARVATSYAACATGAQALDTARARILAGLSEVALVVGADTTPEGLPRAQRRRALGRPRLAALPAARA